MPRKNPDPGVETAETADSMGISDNNQNLEGDGIVDYENMATENSALDGDGSQDDAGMAALDDNSELNGYDETGTTPEVDASPEPQPRPPRQTRRRQQTGPPAPILTLEVGADVETLKDRENAVWHEIKNSQMTGTHLTGILGKVERLENGGIISVVEYKGQRIAIPLKEMMLGLTRPPGQSDAEFNERSMRVLNGMMGAEMDFIVRGITGTGEERAAVASRKAAMMRLRRRYYLQNSASGKPQVYPDRIVEARIIAVSQLAIRVEIFGVETPIRHRDLSWGYVGDCRDSFFVGDSVQVRIKDVEGDTPETLVVRADIKSLTENNTLEKLATLKPQTNVMGKVMDVNDGVIFINLVDGIRAISHKCLDQRNRKPGRGDDVLFVCTRIDEEGGVAIGIISRIVKRNI